MSLAGLTVDSPPDSRQPAGAQKDAFRTEACIAGSEKRSSGVAVRMVGYGRIVVVVVVLLKQISIVLGLLNEL